MLFFSGCDADIHAVWYLLQFLHGFKKVATLLIILFKMKIQLKNHEENYDCESTVRYLKENEHAFSLPREGYGDGIHARKIRSRSIIGFIKERFLESVIGLIKYLYLIAKHFGQLQKLSSLKSSKNGVRAIVLGNGPSLGYLSEKQLLNFQNNGGEVFAVNFWHSTHLGAVPPDYLIISDGATLADPHSPYGKKLPESVKQKNITLYKYLIENKKIKIFCPISRVSELEGRFDARRIYGFVDQQMRLITKNIDPRFPRGYVSMTLFKTLAISTYMGYNPICVLGMDNTYPRDTFCDSANRHFRLERHAGGADTLFDLSSIYPSMDVWAQDMFDLFSDLHRCFKNNNIINLDPYSLTDAFYKIEELSFFETALGIKSAKH
jgi:hypothetical protein